MINSDRFPPELKKGEAVLIPKGPYKPIYLLVTLAKGIEAVIEQRLRNFAEEWGLLSEGQQHFRKYRSVLTAIDKDPRRTDKAKETSV